MIAQTELSVSGRPVKVSNLKKVLYPRAGFTKGSVIDYYIRIAPYLLPHLKDRALTLKRYPEGVEGAFFYEKRCPSHRPDWVKTAAIWSRTSQEYIRFCLINDLPSLVWAANLADLELHTSLARRQNPKQPTVMVFDLDPGPPAHVLHCARVAVRLRAVLEDLGLKCFAKTSGSKGLQVYAPLNTKATFPQTKDLARALAERLARAHPREIVHQMSKSLRRGKVFVDWSQNDDHKTTVCVYSLRAKERPTVSTPVTWKELEQAERAGKKEALVFESEAVLDRVERQGDLFAPVLELKQRLPRWNEAMLAEARNQ